jgi:hypothetical protein
VANSNLSSFANLQDGGDGAAGGPGQDGSTIGGTGDDDSGANSSSSTTTSTTTPLPTTTTTTTTPTPPWRDNNYRLSDQDFDPIICNRWDAGSMCKVKLQREEARLKTGGRPIRGSWFMAGGKYAKFVQVRKFDWGSWWSGESDGFGGPGSNAGNGGGGGGNYNSSRGKGFKATVKELCSTILKTIWQISMIIFHFTREVWNLVSSYLFHGALATNLLVLFWLLLLRTMLVQIRTSRNCARTYYGEMQPHYHKHFSTQFGGESISTTAAGAQNLELQVVG